MKTKLSALLLGAGLLAGCVVDSEQPFYSAADLAFDQRLLGDWREPAKPGEEPSQPVRIERDGAKGYLVQLPGKDGKREVIELHLFKLGGQLYGDHRTRTAEGAPARHQLMRVDALDDTWKFSPLNYGWVRDYLRAHPKALAHQFDENESNKDNPPVTLTATTAQLQLFLAKHRSDAGFFGEPTTLDRANASSGKLTK